MEIPKILSGKIFGLPVAVLVCLSLITGGAVALWASAISWDITANVAGGADPTIICDGPLNLDQDVALLSCNYPVEGPINFEWELTEDLTSTNPECIWEPGADLSYNMLTILSGATIDEQPFVLDGETFTSSSTSAGGATSFVLGITPNELTCPVTGTLSVQAREV